MREFNHMQENTKTESYNVAYKNVLTLDGII